MLASGLLAQRHHPRRADDRDRPRGRRLDRRHREHQAAPGPGREQAGCHQVRGARGRGRGHRIHDHDGGGVPAARARHRHHGRALPAVRAHRHDRARRVAVRRADDRAGARVLVPALARHGGARVADAR